MTTAQRILDVSRQLEATLGNTDFPAAHRRQRAQLLDTLQKALQVTVVGLPKSGKTSLINILLSEASLPSIPEATLVEVVYGDRPKATLYHADGSYEEIEGMIDSVAEDKSVDRARIELPDEHLRVQSYAEVNLTGTDAEIARQLEFLSKTSALVIWCSEDFSAQEETLWASVPDHIKDHGFLALTKADRRQMKGDLAQRIEELESVVSEEFFGLYPIAIPQAMKARGSGESQQYGMWSLCGGKALTDAIDQQVALGRAEDLDRAQALLEATGTATEPEETPSRFGTKPSGSPPPKKAARREENRAEQQTQKGQKTLQTALHTLQVSAESLVDTVHRTVEPNFAGVIDQCIETIRDVSDLLGKAGSMDTTVQEVLKNAQQGEDMLLLLQLENNENAAADAVSLMVQLKKEVFARTYA